MTARSPTSVSAALALWLVIGVASSAQRPDIPVSGRVVSAATGQPVPGARVGISIADYGVEGPTAADGRFHVGVREPGRHRLSVSAPGYLTQAYGNEPEIGPTLIAVAAGQEVSGIEIRLHRGATIAGVVTDDVNAPAAGFTVRAYSRRFASGEMRYYVAKETKTDDRGVYRLIGLEQGQYTVGATDREVVTFAPAAASPSASTLVTVATDAERNGVNIQLRAIKTGTVEGQVGGPGLGAPSLKVELVPDPKVPNVVNMLPRAVGLAPDGSGRFNVPEVAAGRYNVIVRPGLNSEEPRAWGIAPVTVTADGVARAAITLTGAPRVSGTIETVGVRSLSIRLSPVGSDHPEASPNSIRVQQPNGPFVLTAVPPGRYAFEIRIGQGDVLPSANLPRLAEPGTHRLIGSVFLNGEDISDRDFVVGNASIDGVRVAITETAARISGTVLDAAGKPITAGAVVVMPSDPREWTVTSRRIRVTRADTAGVFHVPLLPPGRYRVARVAALAPGQLWDRAFLQTLINAREVTLAAGQVVTVELR